MATGRPRSRRRSVAAVTTAIRATLSGPQADPEAPVVVAEPSGRVTVGDVEVDARLVRLDGRRVVVEHGQQRDRAVLLEPMRDGADPRPSVEVVIEGWRLTVVVESDRHARLRERARRGGPATAAIGATEVRAVIPGRVVSVSVAEGDRVQRGQSVVIIEAMKMQNELRAPRDGTVRRVVVAAGQTIELGDLLLVLE
jgi:biotin carboxyl carrier protein